MQKAETFKASRLQGVMQYFAQKSLRTSGQIFLVVMIVTLLNAAVAAAMGTQLEYSSLSLMYAANVWAAVALCGYAANSETRYLSILPTPRWSIYLGILAKIVCFAVAASLLALVHSVFEAALYTLLGQVGLAHTTIEVMDMSMLKEVLHGRTMAAPASSIGAVAALALGKTPGEILSIVEMCGFAYLYICLLRRWKMQTLAVTIGLPILMVSLFLIPQISGLFDQISSMSEEDIMRSMPMLYNLALTLRNIALFMVERWPIVKAVAGAVCWLLAYPVMRGTSQPS